MLTPVQLTWPGVDKDRARGAAWHLARAAQLLSLVDRHPRLRLTIARAAGEHLRIAWGTLGAIGFEHSARLFPVAGPPERPGPSGESCPRVARVNGCECRHCSGRCYCTPLPPGGERLGSDVGRTLAPLGL